MQVTFSNRLEPAFEATVEIVCSFEDSVPPSFAAEPPEVALSAGSGKSWTPPEVVPGSFALSSVAFAAPETLATYLSYDEATRTVTFSDSDNTHFLAGEYAGTWTLTNEIGEQTTATQNLVLSSDRPPECSLLTSTLDSDSTIVVLREYGPKIYFPEFVFTGPHTYSGYNCTGVYTQTITSTGQLPNGVTLAAAQTSGDPRSSVAVAASTPVGTFSLTFSCEYSFGGQVLTKTVS